MKTLTETILNIVDAGSTTFDDQVLQGAGIRIGQMYEHPEWTTAMAAWNAARRHYNLMPQHRPTLLTPPSANLKLDKAVKPSYGLTLQHTVTEFSVGRSTIRVNACPWAGECRRVCVLDNGNGAYPMVQRAREARTYLLTFDPMSFAILLGWELQAAADKHPDGFLFRPNVNSDVEWEQVAPELMNGDIFGPMLSYGYSKNPQVLKGNGWLGERYRVAYSMSERDVTIGDFGRIASFLERGGSVAVATNRRKGQSPMDMLQSMHHAFFGKCEGVMDADLTDEWIFESGVIGDLSAKGKARKLTGGFVRQWY